MSETVSIVLGFVLTTLVGGWWASRLQHRSWERQNDLRLREEEARRAEAVSDEVSHLLDKRLYRMRRLYWAVAAEGDKDLNAIQRHLDAYNGVLYEWNDRLNTNLARLDTHFGPDVCQYLFDLYERFRKVGGDLERAVRAAQRGEAPPDPDLLTRLDRQFEGWVPGSLNNRVYTLGRIMTAQLRDGLVGRKAPTDRPPIDAEVGSPGGGPSAQAG